MTLYCDKCGASHDSSVCPSCSGFGKSRPMTAPDAKACCPKCGGTSGLSFDMTETHRMVAGWGEAAQAGDSGLDVKRSLAKCDDCGARFNVDSLEAKGLIR